MRHVYWPPIVCYERDGRFSFGLRRMRGAGQWRLMHAMFAELEHGVLKKIRKLLMRINNVTSPLLTITIKGI